jgi:hypothetical protein
MCGGPVMNDAYRDHGLLSTAVLRWGLAVLVGVLIAAVSFGVGRATAPSPGVGSTSAGRTESGAAGYPDTAGGAVSAATSYAQLLGGQLLADPVRLREAERSIFTPAALSRYTAQQEALLQGLQDSIQLLSETAKGKRASIRLIPVAYKVQSFDGATARLSIWSTWLLGRDGLEGTLQTWSTATYTLQWLGGWRVVGIETTPGPVPVQGQPGDRSAGLPDQLVGYREYRHDVR